MLDIIEALESKPEGLVWTQLGDGHLGLYRYKGGKISLYIDMFKVDSKTVADVGFSRNDSMNFADSSETPSGLIGTIYHGLGEKLIELRPNVIIFIVMDKHGGVENKKKHFRTAARLLIRKGICSTFSEWERFEHGWMLVMADLLPSDEEKQAFIKASNLK